MNMEVEEENHKMNLKLLVDTRSNKVLYAEAGKDIVDFLIQILSLPIAAIIEPLITKFKEEDMVGCLGILYKSIKAFSPDCMLPNISTDQILNPTAVSAPNLFFLKDHSPTYTSNIKKFYACSTSNSSPISGIPLARELLGCNKTPNISWATQGFPSPSFGSSTQRCNYVSAAAGTVCPSCNRAMSREMKFVTSNSVASPSAYGGHVKPAAYMVMDNLEVTPMSTISAFTVMNKFHIRDISSLVEKPVQVGVNEGVKILKALLETQAVLTTVFL